MSIIVLIISFVCLMSRYIFLFNSVNVTQVKVVLR